MLQFIEHALGLFAGADGDADAAGDFVAAVAHQDGLLSQGIADFDRARSPKWPRMKLAELGV